MKLVLVTDAWLPQVNGVVTTLVELVDGVRDHGYEVVVIHPGMFSTRTCPGYAGIDLAVLPYRALARLLDSHRPDVIHVATEGPLGWAARKHCIRRQWSFTTAFHTKFPEILHAALKVPLSLGYAIFRRFHRPSAGVMVPTQGVQSMLQARGFKNLRAWTHGVDTVLFSFASQPTTYPDLPVMLRPVNLFVGRVSYEKNIEHFLKMDIPGTKVVCGVGPLDKTLREKYPQVQWVGLLQRRKLAQLYASADVFVFPSRNETFGLVMLEAMSCGTPVAAFPVDGPLEVMGADIRQIKGGALEHDLHKAWEGARNTPRFEARERAMAFSWEAATLSFLDHLVPITQGASARKVSWLSWVFHKTVI
jgi:glycosyltransferase involved in cell wall biosynthesis